MASPTPTVSASRRKHPNVDVLRTIYDDLTRIGEFADDDMVLHPANRDATTDLVVGKDAVTDWEVSLIRLTDGTLVMDVDGITANDYFGTVTGILRAQPGGRQVAMPFCGLWRFRNGLIVEHWENAYAPAALAGLLAEVPQTS
jgi:predicted SnoaL-like aldol condensation-catalyzing enzyme